MASFVPSAASDSSLLEPAGADANIRQVATVDRAPADAIVPADPISHTPPPLPTPSIVDAAVVIAADVHGPAGIDLSLAPAPAANTPPAPTSASGPPPLPTSSSWLPPNLQPKVAAAPPDALLPPPPPIHATPPPQPVANAPVEIIDESLLGAILGQMPSWLTSTVVHLAILLLLALGSSIEIPQYGDPGGTVAETGTFNAGNTAGDDAERLDAAPNQTAAIEPNLTAADLAVAAQANQMLDSQVLDAGVMPAVPDIDIALGGLGMPSGGSGFAMPGTGHDLTAGLGDSIGSSLRNRLNAGSRARLVATGGGTPGSEAAVDRALKWLAEHQNADGSWSYDHRACPKCKGRCKNPGNLGQSNVAATAMALLPFLGTGETHHQGKYKKNIEAGLYWLTRAEKFEQDRGSLLETGGRMYGHGLASIVLCEAYGMTHDNWLHDPAQKAVNFIVDAQDPQFGGWRYVPLQNGDTSVVGWQVMALKSAHMAYLKVPPQTIQRAGYFLDSVQTADGAYYGYTGPGNGVATSAIGLLCRMYMGWERNQPALVQGVGTLAQLGPSLDKTGPPRNNLYYDYYATQVMHHYGGSDWQRWNVAMREYLIGTQNEQGHTRGSWYFDGSDHGLSAGGRLYCTAMAAMILEVYYRHMPLYTDLSTKDKFQQ